MWSSGLAIRIKVVQRRANLAGMAQHAIIFCQWNCPIHFLGAWARSPVPVVLQHPVAPSIGSGAVQLCDQGPGARSAPAAICPQHLLVWQNLSWSIQTRQWSAEKGESLYPCLPWLTCAKLRLERAR